MSLPLLFIVSLAAFAGTVILVPIVELGAKLVGGYAHVSDDRWHRSPVPKFGGVAMFFPVAAATLCFTTDRSVVLLLIMSSLMFAVGLIDDFKHVGPTTKFVGQVIAASVLLYLAPAIRITGAPVLDLVLAMAWIVGMTNAFNLLDNIDGLAGGVAAIAGTFFIAVLWLDGGRALAPMAIALAAFVGVSTGFLIFNFKPASIFMGDSGSHLLGSLIAGATLLTIPGRTAPPIPIIAIPVVLLLIPILDTVFVAITRQLAGRSAFVGGRDHTSHRLVALGISERRAVLVLYALAFCGGAVAIGLQRLSASAAIACVAAYVLLLLAIGVYLGHVEAHRKPSEEPAVAILPSELTSRYRTYEVIVDTLLIGFGYYLAFVIRFRGPDLATFLPYFARSLPIVISVQLLTLGAFGKYRETWRTVGPRELVNLLRASVAGVGASVIVVLYLDRFIGLSRTVFAIDAVISPLFLLGTRVALGALDEYLRRNRHKGRAALIYGAGRGGVLALRELLQNAELGLSPVGFIDDAPDKRRQRIEGLPVVSTLDDLDAFLARAKGDIAAVVVSIRDLPRPKLEQVCAMCDARGIEVRRIRFAIESIEWLGRSPDVIRFPHQR